MTRRRTSGATSVISVPAAVLAVPVCLAVLSACAGAGAGSDVVLRDSAGITIVENAAPGEGIARWSLGDAPEIAIGALEGSPEEQLFRVRGALRLADGRIAIANGGTNEIRFFDASGNHLETIGRDGEGPGEFRRLGALLPFHDSLFVPDFRLLRVSVLSGAGAFARSFPFPRLGEQSFSLIAGIFGDGTVLIKEGRIFFAGEERSGLVRDSSLYYRMDRDGAVLDTLGEFPDGDAYVHAEGQGLSVTTLMFGRQPSSTAGGNRFYYGSGDQYEVSVFDVDGTPARVIRLDRPPRAVTPADIEQGKAERLENVEAEFLERSQRMLDAMPIPPTMPAFSDLEVDADGNLWVQSYRAPGDESATWTIFDPEGRLLAEIDMPSQFAVFQIGADWLLGRRMDELEVEHVELYRLSRDGA